MCIDVRETTESDLPAIFRIVTDPQVRPMQFRLSRNDTIEGWKRLLFAPPRNGAAFSRCTSIVRNDKIIGHVNHLHFDVGKQRMCYCGWNLAPEYWGRGITVLALSKLFDQFFREQQINAVISECFASNRRCLRVLEKLNYLAVGVPLHDRLRTLVFRRCLHWIRRFQLTADRWYMRTLEDVR